MGLTWSILASKGTLRAKQHVKSHVKRTRVNPDALGAALWNTVPSPTSSSGICSPVPQRPTP
jgi:hypothetical protein